jgi:HAD superfamily hydrolase (TIGR01509 family)
LIAPAAAQRAHRPAAVILDMDGLLLDTEPLAMRAWDEAAATLGVAFDRELAHAMIGRNFADCCALVRTRYETPYPVDALLSSWHATYDAIVEREGLTLKPGVHELLDWLDAQAIARAVATSTRHARAQMKLERARLWPRVHALVGGDDVMRGKPAPDIVIAAAARLGVDVCECIVVEDSEPGVEAALAAGAAPIMVPDLKPPSAALRAANVIVFDSLLQVRAYLDALGCVR